MNMYNSDQEDGSKLESWLKKQMTQLHSGEDDRYYDGAEKYSGEPDKISYSHRLDSAV